MESITVEINCAGYKHTAVYQPIGEGNYPYNCDHAEKYPNAMVYQSESGAWLTLEGGDYILGDDGVYRLPYMIV